MANYKKFTKKDKPEEELTDPRLDITMRVVECMKEARDNGIKYQKGWFVSNEFPYNPVTGTRYSGANILSLLADGYDDPRFISIGEVGKLFKETNGAVKIKKGEKCSRVVFAKTMSKGTGEVDPETGEEKTSSFPIYKYHPVFNVSQLDGQDIINERYPRASKPPMNVFEENAFVEEVTRAMESTGLRYVTHAAGKAFYQPSSDTVAMPESGRFESQSLYIRTKLHETGHATGHVTRCARNQTGSFGSSDYAYEELVAELFSQFMGMETGTVYDSRTHDNHHSYLNSWIDVLTSDAKEAKHYLIGAASKAFKGYDFVMDKVNERRQENMNNKDVVAVAEIVKIEQQVERKKKPLELAM